MARRVIELMDDMHLSSQSTFLDYYYAMQANNISYAKSILVNNPLVQNQIMTADNINVLLTEVNRRELQPKIDIDYFLDGLKAVFEKMITYTRVMGEWDANTQYNVHNFVYYQSKGYYAYTNTQPPIGIPPTDERYWLEYDVRGAKGYGGIDLNLRFDWDSTQDYKRGDVVIFQNKMWYAVADNTNYEPNLNHYPWIIISMPKMPAKTPIQKATPTGYDIGDFWWRITEGDDVIITTWEIKPNEPTPRFASSAFAINNVVYTVGGIKANFSRTNINEAYDTVTSTWSVKAPAQTSRARGMGFSIGDNGYVIGGQDENGNILSSVEMYDSITNTWTKKADFPIPIISSAAIATATTGYVVGGETTGNVIVGNSYSYNPTTDTWTAIADKPTLTYGHTLTTDGVNLYAIGGIDGNKNTLGITEAYNIASNTWSQKDTLAVPRSFLSSFTQGGMIYAVGGLNSNWYSLDTNEKYDIANNEWVTDMPMNYLRSSFNGVIAGGKGYAIGGIDLATSSIMGYNEQYNLPGAETDFEMIINTIVSNNIITEDGDNIITEDGDFIIRENEAKSNGSKTVTIPMVQSGKYNYFVDWGDGTTSTIITAYNDPAATHTYEEDGEYTIKLTGTLSQLKFTGSIAAVLTEVTKCKLNLTSIDDMFSDCINLSAVNEDIFDNSVGLTSAKGVFNNCQNLSIIPVGLFDNNVNITTFESAFEGTSITNIPTGFFNSTNNVTSFNSTFKDCFYLVNIPNGLFDNTKVVLTFNSIFANCSNLGAIPNNLFINNPTVTDYSHAFENCTNITSLPVNLFGEASVSVNNFSYMFANTGLNTLPEGLFSSASSATNYDYVFNGTNITAIPANCFNGTNATSVNAFDKNRIISIGDNGLNGLKITAGYFSGASSLVTIGDNIFKGDIDITNLFNNCINLTSMGNMDFTGLPATSGTFNNCVSLTNLSGFKDSATKLNPTINENFSINNSVNLNKQSLLNISDSLITQTPTTIKTLYLSDISLGLLTDVEKLVIINKYWNLDGYTPNITEQIAKDLVLELKGYPGLTSTIAESTSLYYYVNLRNTSTATNIGTYVVDKKTGYVYEEDNLPQYEYHILAGYDNSEESKSYWVAKGIDNDVNGNVLRNKLSELNKAGNLISIQVGVDNSGILNTGIVGNINLNSLCKGFTHLNLFMLQDTNATPTNMAQMFDACSALVSVDFGDIDVSKVTNMSFMFRDCSSMTNSSYSFISSWSNTACTTMEQMFVRNKKLTLMLNIKMPNVTNAANMYQGSGITSITGNLLGTKITNASKLFADCVSLTGFPSDYRTIFGSNSALTDVSYLFRGCTKLAVKLDNDPLSYNQDGTITINDTKRNNQILRNCPNVTNASHIFESCTAITDLPVFVFWYNTKLTDVSYAFSGCSNMAFQAPETGAETALLHNNTALTNISYLFQGCKKMVSFLSTAGYWGYGAYDTLTKLTNVAGLFKNSGADSMLFDIGLPKKSPNITDISEFYSGCESVTNIPFGAEVATNMPKLQNCSKLCYNCTNINQFGSITGTKEYGNNVIYPIAQLSTLKNYSDAFTNCSKLTDYANLPMGWRAGSTSTQNPNNIAIALAKIAWGINPDSYSWSVTGHTGNEYNVDCRSSSTTALVTSYIVNVQTGKVVEN